MGPCSAAVFAGVFSGFHLMRIDSAENATVTLFSRTNEKMRMAHLLVSTSRAERRPVEPTNLVPSLAAPRVREALAAAPQSSCPTAYLKQSLPVAMPSSLHGEAHANPADWRAEDKECSAPQTEHDDEREYRKRSAESSECEFLDDQSPSGSSFKGGDADYSSDAEPSDADSTSDTEPTAFSEGTLNSCSNPGSQAPSAPASAGILSPAGASRLSPGGACSPGLLLHKRRSSLGLPDLSLSVVTEPTAETETDSIDHASVPVTVTSTVCVCSTLCIYSMHAMATAL